MSHICIYIYIYIITNSGLGRINLEVVIIFHKCGIEHCIFNWEMDAVEHKLNYISHVMQDEALRQVDTTSK